MEEFSQEVVKKEYLEVGDYGTGHFPALSSNRSMEEFSQDVVKREYLADEAAAKRREGQLCYNALGLHSEYDIPVELVKKESHDDDSVFEDAPLEEHGVGPVDHTKSSNSEDDLNLAVVKKELDDATKNETAAERREGQLYHNALGLHSEYDIPVEFVKQESDDDDSDALIHEPPASYVQMSSDASTSRTLEHTGEKYQASERFKVKRSLDPHRRTRKGEKLHQCEECHKCFSTKQHLVDHNRTHTSEKPYHCNDCNKCFSHKSSLNAHSRIHTGEKPYQCNECNECFSHKSGLNDHSSKHTGEKYQCNECQKSFKRKCGLNVHSRTHTGKKPYQCKTCEKCFTVKFALVRHIRRHTGEKPYQCKTCEKCFPEKTDLVRHIRTHTGEKPYQCDECNKCFSHKSTLNGHSRVHTGEKP